MKSKHLLATAAAFSFLLAGALAHAAPISGTVTDKTTGKPAVGDDVVLLDVQAGMGQVAHATTNSQGHYTLEAPGAGPYLIRDTHQGAAYFIAAPQGGGPGDIPVYDVTAHANGVRIEADVMEIESDNGQLKVTERYFVHNTSQPPVTQWSPRSFQLTLPTDAVVDGVGAQRPSGLPTNVKMDPDGPKGHYSFNFPIQPDEGDKDTLFEIGYHVPYASNSYTFKAQLSLPADNVAVLLPKGMSFANGPGAGFTLVPQDPNVQTYLYRNAPANKVIQFTVSGTGSIPRDQQGQAPQAPDNSGQSTANNGQPGGGIGAPINTPDPLSKYKWWILGGLALLLAAAAAFLLRKPANPVIPHVDDTPPVPYPSATVIYPPGAGSGGAAKSSALLNALKEELFSLESEKISGAITPEEYATQKNALEIVLKRALEKNKK